MPSHDARTPPRRIALAGASGLVGRALLAQALSVPSDDRLHLVVRRRIEGIEAAPRVTQQPVDFAALPALPPLDEAWCALGTTIRQARSEAAFRAVDFDAVLAFARAAKQAGATRFAVVSALGADPTSRVFYNRVKGEMEQAVADLGFATVVIARPSLLIGDREALGQPPRFGERLARAATAPLARLIPVRVRPIAAEAVARGMLAAMRQPGQGVRIIESAELQSLGT
jgi:uncharacterized protein YbjT (DUF2867 family)